MRKGEEACKLLCPVAFQRMLDQRIERENLELPGIIEDIEISVFLSFFLSFRKRKINIPLSTLFLEPMLDGTN